MPFRFIQSQGNIFGSICCHAAWTGLWVAPLHYRALQRQQALLLHRSGWRPRCQISVSPPSLEDLEWWVSSSPHSRNRQDITLPPPPLGPYHHDRCIFAGLGSDLQWQDNRGTLECGGGRTTHQWPRARGGHPRLEVIPGRGHEVTTPDTGSLSSTAYPSGDGQYYGGYIREQGGGGHSIPFSVPAGLGTVVFPVDQGSVGNSPSPTKGVECGGRHSFTGVQRTNRKDAAEKSLPGHKFVTSMFPR